MVVIRCDILIVGAGLTGLSLAYFLRDQNLNIQIAEARERLGGRIHTTAPGPDQPPVEMGATWLGQKHKRLVGLLKSLNLGVLPQSMGDTAIYEPISTSPFQLVSLPPDNHPSYRIQGGSAHLIEALASHLPQEVLHTSCPVERIIEIPEGVRVACPGKTFEAKYVVSTLPPNLLKNSIAVSPPWPNTFSDLMAKTHTWMGESIKFGLTYAKPFWREAKTSGTVFSNVGPVTEMYDHSNFEDNAYALKGFVNGNFYILPGDERLERILTQLRGYYGDVVNTFLDYREKVWANEAFTFCAYDQPVFPHQNN